MFQCPLYNLTKNSKKSSFFQVQKLEYLRSHLSKLKKQTHSEILLLRWFKWAINELFLKKKVYSPTYCLRTLAGPRRQWQKLIYFIHIRNITSLILFYCCWTLPFERCTLKTVVPKFHKSSVGLQLTTLLENKFLHKYFSRFLPTF